MAVDGAWFVTPHAVRRYIERVDPSASYEGALASLVVLSTQAHPVREISPGVWQWRGPRPGRLRFRVSTHGAGLPQLVTVMRAHDRC